MIDIFDVLALVGLVFLGIGLWMVYPPAAFIVVGAIVLVFGIVGAASRGRGQREQGE